MIDAPTLEELRQRASYAEVKHTLDPRPSTYARYLHAQAAYERALIVQARADAAMRGEP